MKSCLALLFLALFSQPLVAGALRLTLPPTCYGVVGLATGIWFDNIVLTEHPENYRFEVKCDVGSSDDKRWLVTPKAGEEGDHALEITVKDGKGTLIESGKTVLHVAPKNAGEGREFRLMIVGDSLTGATMYPNEIGRLLAQPGNPKWTMIGTSKPASAIPGVVHEGYGGWTWSSFLSKWDPQTKGVTAGPLARKSTSPFLFADAKGKGVLDLPRYFKEQCQDQRPDVITFLLGINDCFGANPDDAVAMDKHINGVLDTADKLLAAFHAAAPKSVLAVGLTTPPNSRESGFEANYHGKYHRWGWKRIQHRLVELMLKRLSHREQEGIVLVPTELNVDPVAGYPGNNGVHPNAIGYAQIGSSFYAWMKNCMSQTR